MGNLHWPIPSSNGERDPSVTQALPIRAHHMDSSREAAISLLPVREKDRVNRLVLTLIRPVALFFIEGIIFIVFLVWCTCSHFR